MIEFIIGAIVGSVVGVIAMCLCNIAKYSDKK